MSDMPEGEEGWRAYYEHPLTAATTAMLNINGAGDEQAAGIGLLYEYYKLPSIDKAAAAAAAAAAVAANDKPNSLPDLWSTAPGLKATNGVDVFLATNAGIKREPEDLTSRKSPETSKATGKPNGTPLANGDHHPHSHDSVHVKQEPADSPPDPLDPKSPRTPSTPDSQRDMSSSVQPPYPTQVFANIATGPTAYDHVAPYGVLASPSAATQSQFPAARTTAGTVNYNDYYRDYYPEQYGTVRQQVSFPPDNNQDGTFVDRYIRHNNNYKGSLTVDLPSPDSGIGESAITPRDSAGVPQMFDYNDSSQLISSDSNRSTSTPTNRRPWTDFSRNSEADKIQIPKIFSNVGFRYFLEAPISTSQRREDDRITYINKGQFYGITMEYIPDPDKPLKSQTVKSLVMLVFREEKSPEEENKAWQFWHSRQHSVKQRILDADTKNSSGLVGCIEEVAHNTIAIYWNPLESQAKINVAVQCLSTDFSNQKGVKGLPLHLQIDTYDDVRESGPPVHRGYCQIKVFCDKGAERKTRDEERRAAKRKLTATGRKKMDELYHGPCDRSEFYSMSDLLKPPALFTPTEDLDKITSMELNFYSPAEDATAGLDKKLDGVDPSTVEQVFVQPPVKRAKLNPPSDRVMLYVRREEDEIYNALHLVPPTLSGLATAIENKYKICGSSIRQLYKRSRKGITVKMDDDMIRHYSNEDTYIIEIKKVVDGDGYDVTLTEL